MTPGLASKQGFTSRPPKIPAQSVAYPGQRPVRETHSRASQGPLARMAARGIQPHESASGTTKLFSITTRSNLAASQLGGAARVSKHVYVAPVDPLFLFYCSLIWHKQADSSAGWELVHFLRS